jgi:predicted transcriptional regulator
MKQEFVNFVKALMEAAPEVAENLLTDDIQKYLDLLEKDNTDKPEITDNGKVILDYMQKSDCSMLKARDIGEGLCVSSRNISGALRKLVTDGFCEKMGQNPVVYTLTEKGKNFKID